MFRLLSSTRGHLKFDWQPSAGLTYNRRMANRSLLAGAAAAVGLLIGYPAGAQEYDLLLQGGHLIDGRNKLSGPRDIALKDGKVAAVESKIDPARALKTVNVKGLYVVPGLIDIHAHVYTNTGERASYAGDNSVPPDGFTYRNGITTVVDAGGSGWRNFPDFKQRIIDRSKTRVLAFLNIVGNGMRGGEYEHDQNDMDSKKAAEMAMANKGVIVGIKTAHYRGPEWTPVEHAVEAGNAANIPVMVDFGNNHPDKRPLEQLLTTKLRPGDIYTHVYSGLRGELLETGKPNPGLLEGRKRGVIFDVGHGGGSFNWGIAVPLVKSGFWPDSISTDLHIGSMNAGMKDMLNVMDKFLALGMSLDDVILRSTWNPAREIKQEQLGHLSVGAIADVAVLRLEKGDYGFVDMNGARLRGNQKLTCELTLRDGRVVYDLNGLTREDWNKLPAGYGPQGDGRWDATIAHRPERSAPATAPSKQRPQH
jgi:dihydroorotase